MIINRRLGEPEALPKAAALAVKGMREGGRRRVLLPPQGGWVTERTQVAPSCWCCETAHLAWFTRRRLTPYKGCRLDTTLLCCPCVRAVICC
jgi:hypothetical protein